jgi:hypothetical protein
MKYATVDAAGAAISFYDDSAPVPQSAIPITDVQWLDWVANQHERRWQDGALVTVAAPAVIPKPIPPSPREWLERLSSAKQSAIAAGGIANPSILLWLLKASGSTTIDVTLQETRDGVAALVTAGILTTDDQTILLTP